MSLNRVPSRYLRVLLGVALFLTAFPLDASAWWNSSWTRRRKVFFLNSGQPSNLTSFPVLVPLDATRIDYGQTQNAGQDIRFVDADDTTQLNHEIELWNEAGTSYVWVRIPQINASSNADFMYVYYGNPTIGDGQNVPATWDPQFMMVHHLNETAGAHTDSATADGASNDSVAIDVQPPQGGAGLGQIDGADNFSAASADNIDVADHPNLEITAAESFTVEAWIRSAAVNPGQFMEIVAKDECCIPTASGYDLMVWNDNRARFIVYDDAVPAAAVATALPVVTNTSWHYIVGRWTRATQTAELFVDGVSVASQSVPALSGSAFQGTLHLAIGEEADATRGFNFDGQIDEVRLSKVVGTPRSSDWIRAQYLSMTNNYLLFGAETEECCSLSTTMGATTITVTGANKFEMRFNTATGGGIDQFFDLVEDPGRLRDLAGGDPALGAFQPGLLSDEVEFYSAGFNNPGYSGDKLELLEHTPARVRVREESVYQRDFAPFVLAGLKGFGDYSLYGSGRVALRWNRKATQNVPHTFQQRQLAVHYQAAAPLNAWAGYSQTFGPDPSPFGGTSGGAGTATDDFVLAQINQAGARTDFLAILSQDWAAANDTFFGDIAADEWEELSWRDTDAGTILAGAGPYALQPGETWMLLTYFKPTNFVDRLDPAVISRAADYRTPAVPYSLSGGAQWQDASENTPGAGDFFNESEAAYVFDLTAAAGGTFSFDLNGSVQTRYQPFFKIRQWRSFSDTTAVSLEGVSLVKNVDYSAAVKPIARAHFAQDLLYHTTLANQGRFDTFPQAGNPAGSTVNGVVAFVNAHDGDGAEFSQDGEYLAMSPTGNFDPAQGSIEFWYRPYYNYGEGNPDPDDHALFGYWIDANNFFYASHDPGLGGCDPSVSPCPDDGLVFEIMSGAGNYSRTVLGAGVGFPQYWRANEWVHLRFAWRAASVGAQRVDIYVNGTLATPSASSVGPNYPTPVATEATFNIGDRGRNDVFTNYANGIIDEFQIFSSYDSPRPLANGGLPGSTEYLVNSSQNFPFSFSPRDGFFRGEYLYLGADSKFRGLNVALATAGAGVPAGALYWEYWDGNVWSNLETAVGVFTDQTASFTKPAGTVFWNTDPSAWTPYSLSGGPALYYVRASLDPGPSYTTTPVEAAIKTDILLFQYCGNISAIDQTFSIAVPLTTAVTLSSFSATGLDSAVNLSWATASELENLGFHLYRAESEDGPYTRITSALIPGLGSSPTGQSYSYVDSGLVNGRRYFYKLEDVETTGKTELHGPVSAIPSASSPGGGGAPPSESGSGSSGTAYGDPSSVVLREVERSARHVVLELRTGGFYASAPENGRVHLTIPGFESASRPGEPELPMRRALVEAVAGRKVRLASILASDVQRFPGLRPSSEGIPEIEVSEDGSILPSREASREGPAFRGLFPAESARLQGFRFQRETKKAEVLLFPLRWDGSGLELSRRLLVRLEFSGTEERETGSGGPQGRRATVRGSHQRRGVVAQFVAQERGLYRVDYEEVFSTPSSGARQRRGTSVSNLRLSRQGESVAFHVEPEGAVFGPGSSLYFLSEGASLNPYGDAVYELETNTRGLLMAVERPSAASGAVSEHFPVLEREENEYFQAGLLEAPDLWLWDIVISPATKSYPFTVDLLAASSSAGRLSVLLQGASDFEGVMDHHVRVRINGIAVGETTWDGKVPQSLAVDVPAGVLHEGQNSLDIENVGDAGAAYSMVFLNRFSVSYARGLVAVQGTLEGRFETAGQAVVEGLSSAFLLDTTDTPRWLHGAQATASGVSFPVQAGRRYLATSTLLRPQVRLVSPSTLKSATNQADYLLLAPSAFLPAAQPLLDRRASEGLVTKAVSLEEVYEQFGHGEVTPEAIKEFLEYAYQSWASPSLRYVLLLGDASYDPKDFLQTGVKNWLPGFPVKTSYLWTVSDPAYAAVNGDDLMPDLAIGRLSASSVAGVQVLVNKVLAFEDGGGDFRGRAVLVADNADLAGNFEQDADEIASTVVASHSPQKIYYSQLGGSTRTAIREAFDQGASFLSYVGHGGTVVWAGENFFNDEDVATLAPQPQQPLLMTMNCLNGFFHFPPLNSLSEALLKAEGKGAIGAFSPSGLSVNDPAHLFHKALLQEILSGRHQRLGDAVLAAQEAYATTGAFPELLSIYHLFGDPALRIR